MTKKTVQIQTAAALEKMDKEVFDTEQMWTRSNPKTLTAAILEMKKRHENGDDVAMWVFPSGRCYVVDLNTL